ncbi:MAG: esterase-like activity of phytase family protein [Cyanobacteria bacterium]|nr:esterase-like activity of phytase family protein [Cyanobacteriota bacterium]
MPCPLSAGWDKVAEVRLPRLDGAGQPSGGFSAATYRADRDELWLLSDAPMGQLVGWSGLGELGQSPLRPLGVVRLRSGKGANLPPSIDGEGLVLQGKRAWVASEGRRSPEHPPQLLGFDRRSGELELAIPMPTEWQPAPGRGLAANRGPESLTLLQRQGKPAELLMAAESALLQDPPGQVRVLGWPLASSMESGVGDPKPLQPLQLPPGDGWGLTDLLALPEVPPEARLLGLQRRFQAPDQWSNQLVLYPLPKPITPGANAAPLTPLISWDLKAIGLSPDNWEAITAGPPLEDGRPTLLLASDDNFSPFQANHLARLAPRRNAACRP